MSRALALVLAAATLAGCSYATIPSAPSNSWYRDERFAATCSPRAAAPVADLFGAIVGGLGTALALSFAYNEATHEYDPDIEGTGYAVAVVVGLPFGGMLLGYGFSFRHGQRYNSACKAQRIKPVYRSPRLELADDLVESARQAAARGDCPATRALLVRAQRADAAIHAAALEEPAIARCAAP
jgi:hypothetical protein